MTLQNSENCWSAIKAEAQQVAQNESLLQTKIKYLILDQKNLSAALSQILANELYDQYYSNKHLAELFDQVYQSNQSLIESATKDLYAVQDRDPACQELFQPLLYFKGFKALQVYRIANVLWNSNRKNLALELQSKSSSLFGVDIHPAARLGHGILIDHATAVVIGETAVVENNVSLLHEVTLGGNGKETGDRHPKIRSGVLIGAGAKILGNIEVGECSVVAACSVVLQDVPAHSTVAGVPAKIIGASRQSQPAITMDHKDLGTDGECAERTR